MPAELAGMYVAWSPDGLRILGHGATIAEARAETGGGEGLLIQKIPSARGVLAPESTTPAGEATKA